MKFLSKLIAPLVLIPLFIGNNHAMGDSSISSSDFYDISIFLYLEANDTLGNSL